MKESEEAYIASLQVLIIKRVQLEEHANNTMKNFGYFPSVPVKNSNSKIVFPTCQLISNSKYER